MSERYSWLSHQPLIRKLLLAFGVILLMCAATYGLVFETLSQEAKLRADELRQLKMIQLSHNAVKALQIQELAARDYLLLAGNQLETLRAAGKQRDDSLNEALKLSNAQQQPGIQQARRLADRWDQGLQRLLDRVSQLDDPQQRLAILRQEMKDATNAANADALIGELDGLYASEMLRYDNNRRSMEQWVAGARWVLSALLLISVIVIIAVLWLASTLVVAPIRGLTKQMGLLAEGKLDIEVRGQSRRDEVGAIARGLDEFRRNAAAIHDSNWVKFSSSEVMAAVQTADSPTDFSQRLIAETAQRLGAGIGVFFRWDEHDRELVMDGSYGFQHRKHLGLRYGLGEGLIGQAALERKRITVERVPDDFFVIHSAIGEAVPRNVMAVPLLARNRLLGVFEFGTFDRFTAVQEGFLEQILPAAALRLENVQSVQATQQLLERTRAQAADLQRSAEALRAQEEELRATNDELQGKTTELEGQTQQLLASEEELRVQAEELQASNEELRQKSEVLNEQKDVLQSLQRETEIKAQALARASQYKTDFLANMSHELRTPLNSLLILSNMLAGNENGHLDAEEVESAQVIHDSGSNLLRLINDILDLSKIEAGKMDVYQEEVEVVAITAEVLRHFRHVATDKNLDFKIEVDPGAPATLITDRPKLQQILNNLLGNAFKFTQKGGVTLRATMADAAVLTRIGASSSGRFLALSVQDTGIGIPEERMDSVFEAFEQVDSSTSRKFGGSGLGLAIARRLAELLGGHLVADSKVGEGSMFSIVLPLLVAPMTRPEPEAAGVPDIIALAATHAPSQLIDWIPDDRHTLAPGETSILTIEDDPAFARILIDLIRRKGHRALAAADGESGLELARRYHPTGILLDVMLPGMDGWSVLQHLKQSPATAAIPVHFISAVDQAAKGAALGAVGFLTKPVDRKALTEAFDHLLNVAGKIVRKLLLVDDDRDSRMALTRLLQADNVQIDEVESGEEALERIRTEHYDCIVLDLNLGGISGVEFLERTAVMVALPPVVIYSGQELSREESLKLRQFTDSIVIKGDRSPERLLDEVSLFLHSIGTKSATSTHRGDDGVLAGRSVLLVDDDMRNLFALSKALRARGMEVLMAQDGYKALQQIGEHPEIALVMMDIMMPGMDGYETIGEIRKLPQCSALPIIALTAKAMQGDRDKCLEAGANDYLTKPVDLNKLLSMMRVWLQTP